MFGLVLDGPHQDAFHFTGKPRIDLTRTRILCEIENQQWIILRVRSGQEMKHRRPQTVNVHARIRPPAEQLRRRIAHGADGRNSLLQLVHPTGDAKINQHDAVAVAVKHQIRGLQIAVDDRLTPGVQILQNIRGLDSPLGRCRLLNAPSWRLTQTRRQIASRNKFHYQVKAFGIVVVEIVVDRGNRRMLERGQ